MLGNHGYGENNGRRKRNIQVPSMDISNRKKDDEDTALSIDWDKYSTIDEDEQESGQTEPEEYCADDEESEPIPVTRKAKAAVPKRETSKIININGRDIQVRPIKKYASYSEDTRKLTIYLSQDMIEAMKELKTSRYIPSFSWLVQQALEEYLTKRDTGNGNH